MSRLFLFGGLVCGCLTAEYSSANRSPAPAHRDPLGYSGISPIGGASLIKSSNLYALPAGRYFSVKKSNQKSFRAAP